MQRSGKKTVLRCLAVLLVCVCLMGQAPLRAAAAAAPQPKLVLTLGADLTADQRAYITQYFGVTESEVTTISITNSDERAQLGGLISDAQIGTMTISCALIRLTDSGGIQVKTANMNYVNCNMIATTLSTSGVYNCEVLTAAPYMVSGTGALTGVMMAYEAGSGLALDPEKKALANEELVLTGEIADTVGQDQATLVVNDIKIHIVRDSITDQAEVDQVVDEVIATTDQAAAEAAAAQGKEAPAKLGEVAHEKLCDFGYKFSQMGYEYKDMQRTLERVTHNVTVSTGIKDPIEDTFTTLDDDTGLDVNSILLRSEDNVLGDDALITATNKVALGDHPAEPIDVFTGEVTLEQAGSVKAEQFINGTNDISYQDVNGSYALMDLNGNLLTESIYSNSFDGEYGNIQAWLADGSGTGLLADNGDTLIPFQYDELEVVSDKWAAAVRLTEGTEEDYDYYNWNGDYFQIGGADIYYLDGENSALVGTLTRDAYGDTAASGDYLNIQDRSGVITTYDPSFTPLQTREYLGDFGEYEESDVLSDVLSDSTGYYVSSFHGNYARFIDRGLDQAGVMDRYGNVIVPGQFDRVDYDMDDLTYENNGYFAGEKDGQFVYFMAGGTVTATFAHALSEVNNYGMSARYKADDGSYTLMSADGVETALGTTYDYLNPIRGSSGMFWIGDTDSSYDLLDWHGNVLLSGSSGYSMSANGNYLIAQNGYTSSTLYLVNGASPVALASSVGGAVEVQAAALQIASPDGYTGDPQVELVGSALGADFVDGTDLIIASSDDGGCALFDVSGKQLTEPVYQRTFECDFDWLVASRDVAGAQKYGVLSMRGVEIIPCEYDHIEVLNERWIAAYKLADTGTEDDKDFFTYDSSVGGTVYYIIDEAVIYHIGEEELTSVTLTRDQIAGVDAEDDYLNIEDRTSGNIVTYDGTFTAVGTVRWVNDFNDVSSMYVLRKSVEDATGYSIDYSNFPDGYTVVSDYSGDKRQCGVVDVNGNVVVSVEYDGVQTYYGTNGSRIWADGYFAVVKDGMVGYVNGNNETTCEPKYPKDSFNNYGMAGYFKNADDTYTLVAADGTETTLAGHPYAYADGKFWSVSKSSGSSLMDWHGNVLFEDCRSVDVSGDGRFILVLTHTGCELYAVDGAKVEDAVPAGMSDPAAAGNTVPETDTAPADESEAEPAAGPEPEEEEPAEPVEEMSDTAAGETPVEQAVEPGTADGLLSSAVALAESDLSSNAGSILVLLQQAKTALETENPSAAAMIGSAISLLQSGVTDAGAITTLITAAQDML